VIGTSRLPNCDYQSQTLKLYQFGPGAGTRPSPAPSFHAIYHRRAFAEFEAALAGRQPYAKLHYDCLHILRAIKILWMRALSVLWIR